MKVSIAMAMFNGSSYLPKQLTSFCEQNKFPDELIIVDDGSSDQSMDIIKAFELSAPFQVKVFQNELTLGYSQNFSKALSLVSGEIVFLSDQDDYWLREKIERVCKVFEDNPSISLIVHDLEFCDQNLNGLGHTKIERLEKFTNVGKYHVTGMATAVRREFLGLCLPIPKDFLSHDTWLHLCAYYSGVKLVVPEVLALYRRHNDNATGFQFVNSPVSLNRLQLVTRKIKSVEVSVLELSLVRHRIVSKWLNDNEENLVKNHKAKKIKILVSKYKLKIKVLFLLFSNRTIKISKAVSNVFN